MIRDIKKDQGQEFKLEKISMSRNLVNCASIWFVFSSKVETRLKLCNDLITSFKESFNIPTGPSGNPALAGQLPLRGHDQKCQCPISVDASSCYQ